MAPDIIDRQESFRLKKSLKQYFLGIDGDLSIDLSSHTGLITTHRRQEKQ